jgi:riboflavin biosynthesis pyrimidine reductase
MALFDPEKLKFNSFYPDPDLLKRLLSGAVMTTPGKVKAVMGDLVFPPPPSRRPYLYGCMVLSFDGKMGFSDNPEGHLISKKNRYDVPGASADFWIMNVCRGYADAVILGTGSLKVRLHTLWFAEVSDPDLVKARAGLGKKTEQPLNIIASVDGRDVPMESKILDMHPRPLIMTSKNGAEYLAGALRRPCEIVTAPFDSAGDTGLAGPIRIVASGEQAPDTAGLLAILRQSGLSYISVEAPGYIWHLIRERCLDEYFLNYSGVMAGGPYAAGSAAPFTTEDHPHAALLSLGFHKGFIYTRQKLVYNGEKS